MPSPRIQPFAHNAFRILGLSAGATQAQIDAAARLMRLCTDQIPLSHAPYDAPWIGPVPRRSIDVERAISQLAQPESRIQERLWWFFTPPPTGPEFAVAPAGAPVENIHAGALLRLHHVLITEGAARAVTQWKWLLDDFSLLAQSSDFGSLLVQVETGGAFDKRAQPLEILASQRDMPAQIAALLIEEGEEAAATGDLLFVSQILAMLGSLDACAQQRQLLLEALEDHLVSACSRERAEIDAIWQAREIQPLAVAAQSAADHCAESLEPLARELMLDTAPENIDKTERLIAPIARLLDHIACAFDSCHDYAAAERILERALLLGRGSTMEGMLKSHLEAIHPKAAKQRGSFFYAAAEYNRKHPQPAARFTRARSKSMRGPQAMRGADNMRYLWPIFVLVAVAFWAAVLALIDPGARLAREPILAPNLEVLDTQPAEPAPSSTAPWSHQPAFQSRRR